jgi:hypothetical protein
MALQLEPPMPWGASDQPVAVVRTLWTETCGVGEFAPSHHEECSLPRMSRAKLYSGEYLF